jgi:hypothetical protein
MGVLECSLFNAFIPSMLLPWILLVVPEYKQWGELGGRVPSSEAIVALLCVSLVFAKQFDRQNKFFIVSHGSTMFFAIVDSNMKIVAGVGTLLFFGQKAYWTNIVGFLCVFVSLAVACYEKKLKYDADQVGKTENTYMAIDAATEPLLHDGEQP